ncbi:MAG TPA: hypothetical protein PJ993_00375 [Candidatus Saccharibacteria bacterium]|nr:hypothetical protein [Candidatus Saccharibacteria bacterium]HMT39381.1 hypothetical protein [Candidatus Saccharibacteria bacterium]
MSYHHAVEITNGPSLHDMNGSVMYGPKMRPVSLRLHYTHTGEGEELKGWVEAMVLTRPVADRCRWFIRFRIAQERGDLGPRYRHFYYDSYNREGFELPDDHPMCLLEQFLYC